MLRALAPGDALWLPARGKSLWPLIRDKDALRVERCVTVRPGDLAVVKLGPALVAHLVVSVKPLRTAATNGRLDPPADELLGRVVAFRRSGIVHHWPAGSAVFLRWWPLLARVAKRVPAAKAVIRRLRDS